jgi:hypothetical protein
MKDRSLAQTLALLFGIAFLGAGILGHPRHHHQPR